VTARELTERRLNKKAPNKRFFRFFTTKNLLVSDFTGINAEN
jgi:hypothetical protein